MNANDFIVFFLYLALLSTCPGCHSASALRQQDSAPEEAPQPKAMGNENEWMFGLQFIVLIAFLNVATVLLPLLNILRI